MAPVSIAEKPTQTQNTKKEPSNKAEIKNELFKNLGWKSTKRIPLIYISYPLTEKNNVGLIEQIMPGLLEQEIKMILLAIGNPKYQDYFTQLTEQYPDQIAILEENEENKESGYKAADLLLCPENTAEIQNAIANALRNQVVPIAPANQQNLRDYDPVQERGNAFIFEKMSPWSLFASAIRALENFKFPYDWKNIQKGDF